MTTARRHAWRPRRHSNNGFVLIALVALLVIGGLYFYLSNLSPEQLQARRQQLTAEALTQAQEAIIGYAVRYREEQLKTGTSGIVYGYLPLPDLGSTRNNNQLSDSSCYGKEGCEAYNFLGNGTNVTVIGRFPWRTLGTGPLRDAHGECLWYAVSGSHQRNQPDPTRAMNWDTLSQLDVVVAKSAAAMVSAVTSAHDRPIAVIFSSGPPLAGQDRSASATDNVAECGGNYVVSNYLDPVVAANLGGVTNYLAGTNGASEDTSITNKALSANGIVNRRSDGKLWVGNCPPNDTSLCAIVANDAGVAVTSELLFRTLRGSSYFRTDINSMLSRMADCLRDQVAAGTGFTPDALSGYTAPTDKTVGRIPSHTCYDDTQNPLGYFSHYRDQVFVAAKIASDFTVTDTKDTTAVGDDTVAACPAAIIFAGQRGSGQSRGSTAERDTPVNYLEGVNLTSFRPPNGSFAFTGPTQLAQVSASQAASQDIVRCVPAGASLSLVAPTVTADAGPIQLANYNPGSRTLTLGSADINSNYGAGAAQLFACAWTPEVQAAGSGFRSYFRFRIRHIGEGFTFAVIDGDRNTADVCGASRQHLGYSGDNDITPYILPPKLAIEFDTARNCNSPTFDLAGRPACTFIEHDYTNTLTLRNGRNDPCYTSGCWTGSPMPPPHNGNDNSSHIAVVYWGYGSALNYPTQDDNAHDQLGLPMPTDPSLRPGPRNPAPVLPYLGPPTYPDPTPTPGIAPLDRMGITDPTFAPAFREFHARLELTRSFTTPIDPKNGVTSVQVKFWIEPHPAANISAMSYNPGSPPTLTITAASHGLETGTVQNPTYVVIKDAVPSGYNGEYVITKIDANNFTATLQATTSNPGPYISAMTWNEGASSSPPLPVECRDNGWDCVTVNSANHGLITGNSITISGAIPPEYNGTHTVTRIDDNSYWFRLSLSYQPGPLPPAVATAKALAPRAQALTNTTRPMNQLYPGTTPATTFNPLVADMATVYDEQTVPCGAGCLGGQSCGSDDMCYRPSFRNLRLGFTTAERPTTTTNRARGQLIEIRDRATTWLP